MIKNKRPDSCSSDWSMARYCVSTGSFYFDSFFNGKITLKDTRKSQPRASGLCCSALCFLPGACPQTRHFTSFVVINVLRERCLKTRSAPLLHGPEIPPVSRLHVMWAPFGGGGEAVFVGQAYALESEV